MVVPPLSISFWITLSVLDRYFYQLRHPVGTTTKIIGWGPNRKFMWPRKEKPLDFAQVPLSSVKTSFFALVSRDHGFGSPIFHFFYFNRDNAWFTIFPLPK
jgi:hypothetical protein